MNVDDTDGSCSTHEVKTALKILFEEPEGKRPLERYCCRWDDINMVSKK
jgi:hypothetical protein